MFDTIKDPVMIKRIEEITKKAVYLETEGALKCEFCGKVGKRETEGNAKPETNIKEKVRNPRLLTLLWPDERWICNACLRIKSRKIAAAI